MTTKNILKKIPPLKIAIIAYKSIRNKYGFIEKCLAFVSFLGDYRKYKKLPKNKNLILKTEDLYPRVFDNTGTTPIDPVYFYQDAWLAKKIFEARPLHHFDVGSHVPTIGILSQFTPITMVDIRPLPISLPKLDFVEADITNLPFTKDSISSLSSICVIEHIGLGRYGDPLDQLGTEKAASELSRVLAKNGNLYISVPIDDSSRVYFNAHRAFTREYVIKLFDDLKLIEEKYVYGNNVYETYDSQRGFGTGLYHFSNEKNN